MKNMKNNILVTATLYCFMATLPLGSASALSAQTQQTSQAVTPQATEVAKAPAEISVKPELLGVKLNMPRAEVGKLLGKPARTTKQMDEFKLDGDDLLTVRFDSLNKVRVIQFYCTDRKRAPVWADVVGDAKMQTKPNGSKYARKVVSAEKFWVTMFQSKSGELTTITVSRQATN